MSIQYTDKSTHVSIHHVSLLKWSAPCADLHCVGHAKMPREEAPPAVPRRG